MNEGDGDQPIQTATLPPRQGSFVWEDPPRRQAATSPVLVVEGFDGPLDWLLEMARAQKIDLAQLSILALVEAFADAMAAAMTRTPGGPALDLARWGDWVVMASDLALLRSRLLLPADTPDAVNAQAEAEVLRRQWIQRAQTADAASWLEGRQQLGFEVFARGCAEAWRPERAAASMAGQGAEADDLYAELDPAVRESTDTPPVAGGDLTELLRACLVALRLPPDAQAYQLHPVPFWSVSEAAARIMRLLEGLSEGADLEAFVPAIAASSNRPLRCRGAVASTFVASLELTRDGGLTLDQEIAWHAIHVQRHAGNGHDIATSTASGTLEA
jgi:segregation and condensation protein A